MSSWGANDTAEAKPKFLTTAQKADTFADPRGWVFRNPNTGLEEVLVAIGNLSAKLNVPEVTAVEFITTELNDGSETITVEVQFNEEVTVTGSPQVTISNGDESGDGDGDYTLTYTGTGTTANSLRFTAASQTVSEDDVLTFGGSGNIALNSGTIKDQQNNLIASIAVDAGGSGYTGAPTVAISAPDVAGGTQATATATISGDAVNAITVTNAGTGYINTPTVTFSGGAGTGAEATATLGAQNVSLALTGATAQTVTVVA